MACFSPFKVTISTSLLLVIAALPAAAVDLFVKAAGSGSACTQAGPCALASALATDQDGDRIFVAAGSYTGAGTEVVLLDRRVELLGGWDGAAAGQVKRDPVAFRSILDGQAARRGVTISAGQATLDGFVIRNGNASGTGGQCGGGQVVGCGGGVLVTAAGVTIANSHIADNVADDAPPVEGGYASGGGVAGYLADSMTITGSTIVGNTASALGDGAGGGVHLRECMGSRIAGNRIVDNVAAAAPSAYGTGGGLNLDHSFSTTVANNVFRGNRAASAPTMGEGNVLNTGNACGVIRENCMLSDSYGEAVFLNYFNGTFSHNRVVAGADVRVVRIFGGTPEESTLANNILVAGAGTLYAVEAYGASRNPAVTTLSHNTIVGNGATTGVLANFFATITMTDNLVAGHALATDVSDSGVLIPDHTLFWNNTADGITGTGAVTGDPLFVNAPLGDFHIRPGSAAQGTAVDAGVADDFDGEARPGIGGFDIGADELAPWMFDFGTAASPLAAGYTKVTHATTYSAAQGFGWTSGTIGSRDRTTGSDLTRDFNFTHTGTFAVDVPDGRYRVTLTMGDATAGHGQMAVFLENGLVATVSTAGSEFETLAFDVAVTDGQLTVWLNDTGGSDLNVVINALAIERALPVRLDLGTASSPLAAGYTRVAHTAAYSPASGSGWLGGLVQSRDRGTADPLKRDLNFTPRGLFGVFLANGMYDLTLTLGDAAGAHDQMGVSAQGTELDSITTAKAQFATRTWRTCACDNQLLTLFDDRGGSDANVIVNAIEVAAPPLLNFDFGTATSPVLAGYLQVTHATTYSASRGYGWLSGTIASRDRGGVSALSRDLNFTPDGTFVADVLPGRYTVTVTTGDAAAAHDQMGIYLQGGLVDTLTRSANSFITTSYSVIVGDGQLTVRLRDLGGNDANAVINALTIE